MCPELAVWEQVPSQTEMHLVGEAYFGSKRDSIWPRRLDYYCFITPDGVPTIPKCPSGVTSGLVTPLALSSSLEVPPQCYWLWIGRVVPMLGQTLIS